MSDEKLQLNEILSSIDYKDGGKWRSLSDEQQKFLKRDLYILNRYISSVNTNDTALQARFVLAVNEYYNKQWNALQAHPELLWRTLCMCPPTSNKTYSHEWIGFKKKGKKNPAIEFLSNIYPTMKMDEIELLVKLRSIDELKQLAKDYGYDNKQIKAMFK